MKLRFTKTAAQQLDRVLGEIAEHGPLGASNVRTRFSAIIELLQQCPFAGQVTNRQGIRRMVATPYPYILTYRVGSDEVVIRSIRHTARRPLT